jgi:hypothetical protein
MASEGNLFPEIKPLGDKEKFKDDREEIDEEEPKEESSGSSTRLRILSSPSESGMVCRTHSVFDS